jgi:porin
MSASRLALMAGFALGAFALPARAADPAAGFSSRFDYSGEVFSNLDGGLRRGTVFTGLAQLTLEQQSGEWAGHADLYAPHGDSLSEGEVGDFSTLSNIDAVHQVRLHEAWLQHAAGRISLRTGILAADSEFWGSDGANLFISSAFGAPSVVSGNLPGPPIFPQGVMGARLAIDLGESALLRLGAFDGDAGDLARDNRHGLDISLGQGALLVAEYEATLKPEQAGTSHVRLGAWFHSGEFVDHHGDNVRGSNGFVAVLDHALDQRLSIFARAGVAQPDRSTVPWSIETGVNLAPAFGTGDRLGLGLAYVALNSIPGPTGAQPELRRELIVESTLDWPLGESVSLQPDLQYIVDPGGTAAARNALVAGVRVNIHF